MIAFYLIWMFGSLSVTRFILFVLGSCYAVHIYKRIVNVMKVYLESNNMPVKLIWFSKNIDFIHVCFCEATDTLFTHGISFQHNDGLFPGT